MVARFSEATSPSRQLFFKILQPNRFWWLSF